mmetsp:Transcript_105/g.206  ORF Transcript_105/g.206 Transcript_105/m.206 type:complete len:127 (-) Transcript_105:73-453(-)
MYQLMQKEAFNGVDRLKKNNDTAISPIAVYNRNLDAAGGQGVLAEPKKGYQAPSNRKSHDVPGSAFTAQNPSAKRTQNMWQAVDDGFGSSRDLSNITGMNALPSDKDLPNSAQRKDNAITMKKDYC